MIESFHKGEVAIALDIHERLQPLFKALFETTNPIPIKAALELPGWQVGSPRTPLTPLIQEKRESLLQIIQNLSL